MILDDPLSGSWMILHFLMFPALPLDPEEPFAPVAFLMTT
jgi:hypothetical protein